MLQLINSMFLVCLLIVLPGFSSVTSGLSVLLGHTASVPCYHSCSTVKWFWEELLVYKFTEGNLSIAPKFEGRIKFSEANLREGNISLTISSVEYNDRGWYVCSCDGLKDCDHYLEVLAPTELTAAVGDKAMVPCYAETDKLTSEINVNIRWEKDEKLVVNLEHGEMEFGAGFEGRFSVSREDYKRGNLSLTIHDVRSSDSGLYKCSALKGKNRTPEIVKLIVTDSSPRCNPAHDTITVLSAFIAVFIAAAAVATAVLWAKRRCLSGLV